MPYILQSYVPTEVILKRSEDDGRKWVALPETPDNEFWVGSAQVYDTEEACIIGNAKTLESDIKQMEFEARQNLMRAEKARKALYSVSPEARIEELTSLLKALDHNLEVIEYSCKEDGCTAGRNLAKEAREWIRRADIPLDFGSTSL